MDTKKIVWSEGMFLCPQHFQQQERYLENYIREFAFQVAPNCFGLSLLELDMALLNIGKIGIRSAKGIFPDGTPFTIRQSLVLEIPEGTVNKRVYLALPIARSGVINVGEDERVRYSMLEHQVFDTSREQSDALQIEVAEPNVMLKLEGDELQDYTLIPIAYIADFKPEGGVSLNQAFVPLCLQFGVSSYLKDNVQDIYSQMLYRAKTISTRLQAEKGSKSYQTLMRDYLWLQALGGWLPKFKQICGDQLMFTRHLYLECLSVVGQMYGLEGKMPKEFPAWNQHDLFGIFSSIFSELLTLLREIQIENVHTLKWDQSLFKSRRLLRTIVQDRSFFNEGQFVLVVTSDIGSSKLSSEFQKAAKLAGNSAIADLVRNAISGVPLRNLPYAPSELKSRTDAAYFEVDTQSDLWVSMIKKDEPIALHIDERIENVNVEFHVIR
ncbi:type VI secretion system baseplate subunit TssK [Shewanella sp. 202IG2-18]|uniref:type VI secretion system baseplate subunit TssK n=1 Tax=Parashewanella hymeniacidonis TaxID=2807618 RepID=UPI001960F18D|nr:type VI secretion system baseplate subunit TssK [Parashewanella hymeniacidonis]MBM7071359.1 type VI secretion system baseplate subunit TssK [Parashewanella hymeniacidonis]